MTTTTAPKTFNKIVANGTPLRSSSSILSSHHDGTENPKQISVVSYNVLAPAYVRPLDKRTGSIQSFAAFEWISEDNSHAVLSMEHRGPKLYQILSHCHADIICIQELQLERRQSKNNKNGHDDYYYGLPPWIEPLIAEHGGKYCVVLPSQTELCQIAERNRRVLDIDGAVTVAVLYRVDKFEPFSRNTTAGDENNHNNDEDTQQEATNHTSNNSHDHHKKNKGHSSSKKKKSKHKKKNSSHDQYDHTDQEGNSNRCVSICLQGVQGSDMEGIEPVVVASVHLDATDETKRVGQLARLLKRQTTTTANKFKSNPRPSFIIAGDMNTELFSGSCVSAFLRQNNDNDSNDHESFPTEEDYRQQCHESLRLTQDIEPSKQQLQQWKDMYMDVNQLVKNELCMTLSRIKSGKTRAAYDHATSTDDNTNHNKNDENNNNNNQESSTLSSNSGWRSSMMMGQWALDHMLYSTDTLRPLSVWSTLEADKEAQQSGLPNHKWPSDHLPIGAMFNIQKSPQLTVEERSVLVEQISAFEKMPRERLGPFIFYNTISRDRDRIFLACLLFYCSSSRSQVCASLHHVWNHERLFICRYLSAVASLIPLDVQTMKESTISFTLSSSKVESNEDTSCDNIRLPPEIVHEIIDYAPIDLLLTFREVNKEFKNFVDDDLSPEDWRERTSKLSQDKVGVDRIRVKNRLVLACIKEPRCCLCGCKYSAQGKGTDKDFGVYAHERCRNKRIFRCDRIATMLRKYVPSDKLIEIYTPDIIKLSKSTGGRTGYSSRPTHRPWEHDREYVRRATTWLMPHWSIRETLYDSSLAHSKKQERGSIMASTIVNALDEYTKYERKKRQEKKERDDHERAQVLSRLDNFSGKVGGEMYHHIFYLSSLLQRISKTRRPSYYHGHRYSIEDEKKLQKITIEFSRQTDFVHKGINSIYDKETDTWQDAGAALHVSNWVTMVASAYTAISKVNIHPGTTHNVFHREFKRRKTDL